MKLFLLLTNIVLLNLTLLAQGNIFTYQKKDGVITFKSDTVTIIYNHAVKSKSGSVERLVMANNRRYSFIVKKTTSGKVLEIKDSTGTLRATEFLFGDQKYTLLLRTGEVMKWNTKNKTHWGYQRNGQYALESSYQQVEDEKQVALQSTDPAFPVTEIIQIAFLEKASQNMESSRSTGAMIAIAIGLAVFRIAASSGSN